MQHKHDFKWSVERHDVANFEKLSNFKTQEEQEAKKIKGEKLVGWKMQSKNSCHVWYTFDISCNVKNLTLYTRCLKITEKVSFNFASEAIYFYILSGQKLIKNAKNCPFWQVFENLKLVVKQCYQTGQFQ